MTAMASKRNPDLRVFVTKDDRVLVSRGRGPLLVVDQAGDVSEQYRIEGTCYFDDGQTGFDAGFDAGYARGYEDGFGDGVKEVVETPAEAS